MVSLPPERVAVEEKRRRSPSSACRLRSRLSRHSAVFGFEDLRLHFEAQLTNVLLSNGRRVRGCTSALCIHQGESRPRCLSSSPSGHLNDLVRPYYAALRSRSTLNLAPCLASRAGPAPGLPRGAPEPKGASSSGGSCPARGCETGLGGGFVGGSSWLR